jgi:hypothetical protein
VAHAAIATSEFQVNAYTTGEQRQPAVAVDGTGKFVAVWQSDGQDGSGFGVVGRRYDSAGLPLGGEFQVNTYTTGRQGYPDVAADGVGNFVVVWASDGQDGPGGSGVFARRYDSAGLPLGGEFQVNTYTTRDQDEPAVAADATGDFVVVWRSFYDFFAPGQDGSDSGVFAQRYDSAGAVQGVEFQVNTYTTADQIQPAVALDAAGNALVVWASFGFGISDGQDGSDAGIYGQRYDSAGAAQGGEFLVNTWTTSRQSAPSVAADASGNFVVAWSGRGATDPDLGIFAKRYDGAGLPLGGEFQVNTYTTYTQLRPSVAADGAGGFVVVWDNIRDLSEYTFDLFAQRYDSTALPLGGEFQMNTYTPLDQKTGAVAVDGTGNFLVVWGSEGRDGSAGSIAGQRNKPERLIRGKTLNLQDRTGDENARRVIAMGRERSTEIGPSIDGDPTVVGATLRLIVNGMIDSDQTYVLDASGWMPLGTVGFRYAGPTGADGDPVRRLIFKRTPFGAALIKAVLSGGTGTQSLDVMPPNLGDDGGLVLQVGNDGGTYCVAFGGAAGSIERRDTAQSWKVSNATAEPGCPSP